MRAFTLLAAFLLVAAGSAQAHHSHSTAPHHRSQAHVTVSYHAHYTTEPTVTVGKASWYGLNDGSGHVTAQGKPFNPYSFGLAHSSWPFGSKVRITNLENGRVVVATVLDRNGPGVARNGRKFDLYYGTASALGMVQRGEAVVKVEPLNTVADGTEIAEDTDVGIARVVRAHWERRAGR